MKPSFLATAMSMLAFSSTQAEQTKSEFVIHPTPMMTPRYTMPYRHGNRGDLPASRQTYNQRESRKNNRRAHAAGCKKAFN